MSSPADRSSAGEFSGAEFVEARLNSVVEHLESLGFVPHSQLKATLTNGLKSAASQLADYVELLERWTKRVDLVSQAAPAVLVDRHVVDCAAAWMVLAATVPEQLQSVVDIGSGAGLPGLIWAVLNPESRVLLVEPREKRVLFLREAVARLELRNAVVLCERSETLSDELSGRYSMLTSRAVGDFAETLDRAGKLLGQDGLAAYMVGPTYSHPAQQASGFQAAEILTYRADAAGPERKLALWRRAA